MNIGGIIFDCDGTLVDSEGIGHEVLIECLADEGANLAVEQITEVFRGMKMAESIALLQKMIGKELSEDFVPELRRRSEIVFRKRLQPMDGAVELVRSLSCPICVASNAPRRKTELSLKLTGLLPFFTDRIFSSYEVGLWKPDPGLFLHAADAMNVPPSRCAVVEDSILGIQAGLAAGMQVFALLPDLPADRVPQNVRVVRHLSELGPIFIEV